MKLIDLVMAWLDEQGIQHSNPKPVGLIPGSPGEILYFKVFLPEAEDDPEFELVFDGISASFLARKYRGSGWWELILEAADPRLFDQLREFIYSDDPPGQYVTLHRRRR